MEIVQSFITQASIALQPYKTLVGQAAMVFSIFQMLSPIFVFNNMRKAKSTLGMPFMPFLLGAVLTTLNMRFSLMLNDDAMYKANLVGFTLMIVYISIFFYYVSSQEKFKHLMMIFGVSLFVGVAIIYTKYEDPKKVETRFGLLLTGIMYCFFTIPFFEIRKALKLKSTSHMPLPMILSGFLVGTSWLLHGIIINSGFVIGQNAVGVSLNVAQLTMFAIYPSEPRKLEKSKKEKTKKTKKLE